MSSFKATSASSVRDAKYAFLVVPAVDQPPLPIEAVEGAHAVGRIFIHLDNKATSLGALQRGTPDAESIALATSTLYLQLRSDDFKAAKTALLSSSLDTPAPIEWRTDEKGLVVALSVAGIPFCTVPRTDPSQLKTG